MSLSKRQIAYLNRIIITAHKMLDTAHLEESSNGSGGGLKRRRRSSAEAEKMRADITQSAPRACQLQNLQKNTA